MKLVSVLLVILLLSQVLAEASLSSNAEASVARMEDGIELHHVVALQDKRHHKKINCIYACARRCKKSSRKKKKRCEMACWTCCKRCHCVPARTYGNKETCPCYAKLRTHGNKRKCP